MQLEPIAVIGVGCRFPGASNPQAFWELMRDGQDGVTEIPDSRWDLESFYAADGNTPGKANTKWGGFLEDIEYFDPQFFGIAPKEAVTMDPQQRLLLEVAWETLEDAGKVPEALRGSKTGVFIGIGTHDYSIMLWQQPLDEPYATTGTGNCIAANRISYVFDFKGPSLAVDTACSSSLVAVHLACQSIWTGESSQALAGGVNVLLLPTIMVGFSKGGFMSSEGRCKSFARDADGYVRGEGAGLVLLKPLSQARADGDEIYGLILSTAVNQDGFSNGLAAPNPQAQAEVLREAYRRGNVEPYEVNYVEAHGTGTKVGDPIEMEALSTVIGANRLPGDNCLIGSVKTNIGHTETAAGIAGIIKVALALKHGQIPPSLHFSQPNPAIAFGDNGFEVVTELTPWQQDQPMIAGVNSFGFGGTNAHVVLSGLLGEGDKETRGQGEDLRLLTVSAKSQSGLRELVESYQHLLGQDLDYRDICVASNIQRSHFNHRLSCLAKSSAQLQEQLTAFIVGKDTLGVDYSCVGNQPVQICWLFTGQGSQYVGMAQDLYATQPVFRDALDCCAEILNVYLDIPLHQILTPDSSFLVPSALFLTQYTQPAIFAVEYALAQLWLSWGIKPDYVMGHSIGEYVAACVAGVFSLEAGLKLVARRGRLMADLPSTGGMLAVSASQGQVESLIADYPETVSIAAINHQKNTVVAGDRQVLGLIEEKLKQLGIKSTWLQVSQAFHSPLMQPILTEFRAVTAEIDFSQPQISLISTVTGQLAQEQIANAEYWVDHIIQPVKFAEGFTHLLELGIDVFLEVGAKPILAGMGQTILSASTSSNQPLVLPSLSDKQPDSQVIFNTIGRLYHQGIKIDWQAFNHNYSVTNLKLPTYPFQRQRYWWESAKFWLENSLGDSKLHPLLGARLTTDNVTQIVFQQEISSRYPVYLQDHCLQGRVVFPATAYVELALAAGKEIYGEVKFIVQNLTIRKPLLLSEVSTIIRTIINGDRLEIYSKKQDDLILHCQAILQVRETFVVDALDLASIQSERLLVPNIDSYYAQLCQQGLNYGSNFQGIQQLWQQDNRILGKIVINSAITSDRDLLHPALLDSCLQLIGTVTKAKPGIYLPVAIGSLELWQAPGNTVWAEVTIEDTNNNQTINANLKLVDSQGEAIALINNLTLQYLSLASLDKLINSHIAVTTLDLNQDLYQITWLEQPLANNSINSLPDNWLIFSSDRPRTIDFANNLGGNQVWLFAAETYQKIADNQYEIDATNSQNFQQLWQEIKHTQSWGIIYLESYHDPTPQLPEWAGILHLIQTIPNLSQLVVITQQTQIANQHHVSGIWGLAKTINLEYPDLKCLGVDLENNHVALAIEEIKYNQNESQVAYDCDRRYVPRLTPQANTLNQSCRLQLSDYGTLDNLTLGDLKRRPPQSGEIEIAVTASGVNFRDVLNALGMLQPYLEAMGFADATQVPFGGECAGIVTAVGLGVTNFQVGDKVIAAQAVGSLASHVTVNAQFAILQPELLSATEAATIPTTFLTAYYGLHYLAQIQPGDKILIHSAAGGVGQAAVQLAQQIGAEVYATASRGKWDFLKATGVKYVMNSRNLDFAEEVMRLTEGEGVDIILNSLNGDFIPKNLEILASQGRFVEIGKVGIWDEKQVKSQREDITYFPFDLLEVSQQDPDLIATLFNELREKFVQQELKPLPHKVFPIQSAGDAFRYMAQAKHIGKVVISVPNNNSVVTPDGCYLITGGYGALGLQVAQWLVTEGAKYLILIGRSQPSSEAEQAIANLESEGVKIDIVKADISDFSKLKTALSYYLQVPQSRSPLVPVKGIIHAAGILDDGLLENMSWERFQRVLQPKIQGAWNLHRASQNLDLDWFVCFSSVTSVLGAVGQSNYATANAYLDSLMNYRRSLGLPGLSINWSIWSEVGMATRMTPQQQQRLQQQGLQAIAPPQGLQVLKQLIQQQAQQTVVFPVDWQTFLSQHPPNAFFEKLQPQTNQPQVVSSLVQKLLATPANKQRNLLQEHIRWQIAKVLGYGDPEDIDPQEKFADLGMDSLMAVEFKNNLQTSFGNAVSLTVAFDYPTVELLTNYIFQELNLSVGVKVDSTIPERSDRQGDQFASSTKQSNVETFPETSLNREIPAQKITKNKIKRSISRTPVKIKPEYHQFNLTPEYLNLKKDLERVKQLGNPFFSLHQGIARDTIITDNRELINYSSYNYLGMSGDPVVTAAAQQAIAEYGTSVSASRLLSGERPLHLELETEIANLIGTEDAIAYVGGHATNVTTIGHLFGERDLIICDALSHNSIKEGCQLSGAKIIDFPHNDLKALEAILERERTQYQKVLIAVEGIYSTDGDLAPLPAIVELKQHYQTFLLVDEAHSIGVLGLSGGGVREHFDLQATDVDLWMGTLSKSFASCGGYIAGSQELIQYLKYTAPGFVFSVGMSPANTAAAIAAIQLLQSEPERAIKLQSRAKFCLDLAKSKGFNTGYSANSPVIPIIVGEPHKAVRLSQLLQEQGINVNPMVYPSVPYDAARLRFFITSLHTEAQITTAMQILAESHKLVA